MVKKKKIVPKVVVKYSYLTGREKNPLRALEDGEGNLAALYDTVLEAMRAREDELLDEKPGAIVMITVEIINDE